MKRKVLIWGTGVRGEQAYQRLKEHRQYVVVAFGENNNKLWGQQKYGLPIIGPDEIFEDIDGIVIASGYFLDIREQLKKITKVPIYNQVNEIMYGDVDIDITGFCNAKCKWCVTGYRNLVCNKIDTNYMSVELFARIYQHLYKSGIIEKSTKIGLFNWGEPFLNRDYQHILEYLTKEKQAFGISTNASIMRCIEDKELYKYCKSFIFSMSGFSQQSYDRIHGFSFELIKKNIENIYQNIKACGFEGDASISYHVYKFNVNEVAMAREFAESLGIRFNPYYPYFNGNSMMEKYLENKLTESMRKEAEEELFLGHVDDLLRQRPKEYKCSLENSITIDCNANMVLCCASDVECENYTWGSIFDINSYDEMRKERRQMLLCSTCAKCKQLKIDYWMENNPGYD